MKGELFIPPKFNPLFASFVDLILPGILKVHQNITDIIITDSDKQKLRALKNKRVLLCTNHPSHAEPMITWYLANIMGSRFNYMATRRAFDFLGGMLGTMFSNLGGYSIVPGIADRGAMKMTRQILSKRAGKLTIFPEGEPMCGENDNLMPFQPGPVVLAFGALEDARKQEPDADIILQPGFIKYVIDSSASEIKQTLEKATSQIERALEIIPPNGRTMLRRFLIIGLRLLGDMEKRYEIKVEKGQNFDFRTGKIRHVILDNVADFLQVKKYDRKADAIQKVRFLTSVLEMVEIGLEVPGLRELGPKELQWANRECVLAYDLIVIKSDYLLNRPTPERYFEWLARFESLVLGTPPHALGGKPHHLPRRAHIFLGDPIKLADFLPEYKKNKKSAIEAVTGSLRTEIGELLEDAQPLTSILID